MFPIHIEQYPASFYHRSQPQFSLDDYVQLQLVLAQEQAQRQQAAAFKAYQRQKKEQRRLERAMYKLQVMAEVQRRREQEELAIQAYYAAKREQQRQKWLVQQQQEYLRCKQAQEEQKAYYQALIEKQLEQYRMHALEQQLKSNELMHPSHVKQCPFTEEEVESDAESESETDEKLKSLVKMIFGYEEEQEFEVEQEEQEQEEQEAFEQPEEQQNMTMDELIDYVSKKAQELDNSDHEEEQEDTMDFEHIADDEADSMDHEMSESEEVPVLINSNGSVQDLVNEILEEASDDDEDEDEIFSEDPVKVAKLDALNRIEQELDEVRQKHEDHILHGTLKFPEIEEGRSTSPETLSATSAENKEFLGYEDQIMKLLLKLDTIDSEGDEEIRNKRKSLVKQAERMLETLDEFKQKEWERISCSSHSDNGEDDF
ncbi:hypothetical protein CU098_011129 [Rhizopus stolonifer]|uniref:BAG domain-containing protein n=1 Tax=Rhizopus stolonifer TaxID=4846 RepID=A0A367KD34_RHIST|nr:hypothetical protein CU098_011129 [Rhizopus stolonifer]